MFLYRYLSLVAWSSVTRNYGLSVKNIARLASNGVPHDQLHRRRRQLEWRMSKMKLPEIRAILNEYDPDRTPDLKPSHFAQISALLTRHPLVSQILQGYQIPTAIRVVKHPAFGTACFAAVLPGGRTSIFSYQLCIRGSTTTSLWRVFSDACRQTLFEAGLLDQIKAITRDFAFANPGKQISVQYNQIFQEFSLEQGIVLERPEQLLRLVDRDEMMRWRLIQGPVRSGLIHYFGKIMLSPTPNIFQITGSKSRCLE